MSNLEQEQFRETVHYWI